MCRTRTTVGNNPFTADMELRHDGKVLVLTVVVNSNEKPEEVVARVSKAARGQLRNAVHVELRGYGGADALAIWQEVQRSALQTATNPKSKIVDEDLKPK